MDQLWMAAERIEFTGSTSIGLRCSPITAVASATYLIMA
jgi:hypothetical protein